LARSFFKHDPASIYGRLIARVYRHIDHDGQGGLDYEEACAGLAMMHPAFTQVCRFPCVPTSRKAYLRYHAVNGSMTMQ
jgi:hypothetical protein